MTMKMCRGLIVFSILIGLALLITSKGEDIIEAYAGMSDGGCPYIGGTQDAHSQGLATITDLDFDELTGTAYYAVYACSVILAHNRTTNLVSVFAGVSSYGGEAGDGGQSTSSQISQPMAIKVDPDSRYVYFGAVNGRIRRINLSTGIINTVAGSLDQYNGATGYHGDDGPATSATIGQSHGFYFNTSRYLFTADSLTRIRRIDLELGIITNYAGNVFIGGWADGPRDTAIFQSPSSLWGDGTTLYAFDAGSCVFRTIDLASGIVSTWWGQLGVCVSAGDGESIASATIHSDVKICGKDKAGNFYFADQSQDMSRSTIGGCSIRKVSPDGIVTKYAGTNCYVGDYNGDNILARNANLYLYQGGCTIYEDMVFFSDNQYIGGTRVRYIYSNGTAAPTRSPSASPTMIPSVYGGMTAPPTPAACYWSGEVDGCEGGLEEVVVESSSSSAGYVNDQYVTTTTTVTKTYKKRV